MFKEIIKLRTYVIGIGRSSDEITTRSESLGDVPEHAVGLLYALEGIVKCKLAAHNVERDIFIRIQIFQIGLGAVRGKEVCAKHASVAIFMLHIVVSIFCLCHRRLGDVNSYDMVYVSFGPL
jgi:hypothetical protein